MTILDCHQHFWKYNPVRHAWIDDSMKKIRRDFMPEDLQDVFKSNKVEGCIAVQADQSLHETAFLLELASKYSFIKGVVGWVDLQSTTVSEQLELFSQNKLLKGIRHIVQSEPVGFLLKKTFQYGISLLNKYNLTYDLLIFPNQLKEGIEFASINEQLPIVLDHLAKPYIKSGLWKNWAVDLKELAKRENVFCKLSGMVTEASWNNWQKDDFTPYLDAAMEAFGPGRLMYGSDWPVCLIAGEYHEVINVVKDYVCHLSESEQEMIFSKNANGFYKL